mgnify:CR=1 FL=1
MKGRIDANVKRMALKVFPKISLFGAIPRQTAMPKEIRSERNGHATVDFFPVPARALTIASRTDLTHSIHPITSNDAITKRATHRSSEIIFVLLDYKMNPFSILSGFLDDLEKVVIRDDYIVPASVGVAGAVISIRIINDERNYS